MAIIVTNGRITAFNWVLSPIGIAGAQFITAYGVATLASSLGAPWFAIDLDKVADLNSGSIGNVLPLLIAFLPLLLYDFFYYWFHRFQHANSWLWEQHKLHQSDQSLNVMTTYRHNWLEQFFKSLLVALSHSSRSSRDGGVIRHCDIRALWSAPLAVDRLQVWNWPELPGFQRMKPMAKHRPHSIEFKRQVALEFIAGETLHALPADTTCRAIRSESGCGSLKLERSMMTPVRLISFRTTRQRSRRSNRSTGPSHLERKFVAL